MFYRQKKRLKNNYRDQTLHQQCHMSNSGTGSYKSGMSDPIQSYWNCLLSWQHTKINEAAMEPGQIRNR